MTSEKSIFWPNAPVRWPIRLIRAFVLSPLIGGAFVTLMAFLIAGMSEPTPERVLAVTLEAATWLIPALFVFMASFGALGVFALWWLGQRGLLSWAVGGALTGVLASLLFGEVLMGWVEPPLLIASALAGWALFLLFRWIAGIRAA